MVVIKSVGELFRSFCRVMRSLYMFLSFLIITAFMASCCSHRVPKGPVVPQAALIVNDLKDSTVMLVDHKQAPALRPYCSGVWVSPVLVLTAAHCVVSEDDPIAATPATVTIELTVYRDTDTVNMVAKRSYPAKVFAVDRRTDLAILDGTRALGMHSWVRLYTAPIYAGQPVFIVGHPSGFMFTTLWGIVSSERMTGIDEDALFLQINSSAWFGNSGGGAFTVDGELIGICSFLTRQTPNTTFFSHRDNIIAFFKANHVNGL